MDAENKAPTDPGHQPRRQDCFLPMMLRILMLRSPQEELVRRRPVWEALSEFFLDTELNESQLRHIATVLRASGYAESELEEILICEIAPVLYSNLCLWHTIAGVWDAFDVDKIEAAILAGK